MKDQVISKDMVLFLCTGNSARSQMAEGLLRNLAGERFEVFSAGMDPKGVHPLAIRAMNEVGIDISSQRSKSVKEYLAKVPFRHVIFVCEKAEQSCPRMYPGTASTHSWPFDDPAAAEGSEEARLEKFRQIRDQVEDKIKSWLRTTS